MMAHVLPHHNTKPTILARHSAAHRHRDDGHYNYESASSSGNVSARRRACGFILVNADLNEQDGGINYTRPSIPQQYNRAEIHADKERGRVIIVDIIFGCGWCVMAMGSERTGINSSVSRENNDIDYSHPPLRFTTPVYS